MDKVTLLEKLNDPKYKYDNDLLKKWIKHLPSGVLLPNDIKRGDVYMHPIFSHPYIFIEDKGDYWLCVILTSNGDFEEVLEPCNSRFFHRSYIVKSFFTITGKPVGRFMGVYDNNKHLTKVCKKLKEIFN